MSQTVVVIPLALQNTITSTLENVRGQLFRSCFSGAASDRYYRFSPRGIDTVRQQLQRGDRVLNQQQPILHALQIRIATEMICACDCSDCATLERVTNEAMRIVLREKLDDLLELPYAITNHLTGIRPTTKDRRPLLAVHPVHTNLYALNGLGTNGVLFGPWYAGHYVM